MITTGGKIPGKLTKAARETHLLLMLSQNTLVEKLFKLFDVCYYKEGLSGVRKKIVHSKNS